MKAFPLKSGTRQGCPLSPLQGNIVLEVLVTAINQRRKRNKRNPDWKRSKTLFADDMILYMENPKDSTGKLLELINEYSKLQDIKLIQRSLAFLYTNNEKTEREIKERIPFTIATKRITCLGINLPKETNKTIYSFLYIENYKTLIK